MVDYFVSPPDYTDLKIESSQLAQALQQRWPDVQFISRNDDANTLRWAINIAPGKELWGELAPSGQSVALDGDVYESAEFARWLRGFVPQQYPLIFYDGGYAHDVPVTPTTSVDELTRPFVLQP